MPYKEAVAMFEGMAPIDLDYTIKRFEREVADSQRGLAAARKAQKNQKRAAKDRKKVVG